ncbi:hypothetical protein [Agromyces atrinae]|uniref:Uncharacterized protein n=1 Tax=Agromyces atrinae TaxID=592376 RepID=A0A4Q2MDL9_9MICO|nr:hypothetical protein [Agromyces atrinae]NYD67555.1 hypothetical protein [Agromyces atrinae]RXZ88231.1 hypothetical protein ESP50_03360 [Agromyces atrinae]
MKTTMNNDTWIDLFTLELRMRRVPGAVIGDAVASVRELMADSGQSAEEEFGPARQYAASLALPVMGIRQQALKTVFLPVLGLFAFLVFSLASTAFFNDDLLLLSVPQALLLAVPILLTVMFSFYPRSVLRLRWFPVILVLVAGGSGALATLFSPSSPADAWLVISALPLMIGTLSALVVMSIVGTIVTLRSRDADEIVEPLEARDDARPRGRRLAFLIVTDWLFVILTFVIFAMTWVLSSLRP